MYICSIWLKRIETTIGSDQKKMASHHKLASKALPTIMYISDSKKMQNKGEALVSFLGDSQILGEDLEQGWIKSTKLVSTTVFIAMMITTEIQKV